MSGKIKKENVQDIVELNDIQKGILFQYLKEVNENLYNVQLQIGIEGKMDKTAFQKAVRTVQSGNEALRSVFNWEKVSNPVQIILKDCPLELNYHDLSGRDMEVATRMEQECITSSRYKRFDLEELPLRIDLIRLTEDQYTLVITHHHILYDGWSTGIFLKELFSCYSQLLENKKTKPIAKPLYKDMLRLAQQKQSDAAGKTFWENYLKGCKVADGLPGGSQGLVKTDPVMRLRCSLPIAELDKLTANNKVTKSAIIYAAYALLLHKYNHIEDVVFGTTVSCRNIEASGSGEVMGNFMNTVPFRTRISGETILQDLIHTINNTIIRINDFSTFSYFESKQLLNLKPDQELFNSLVAIENYPLDKHAINNKIGVTLSLSNVYEHISIPLAVYVFFKEELEIEFVYDSTKVDDKYARALSNRFMKALEEVLYNSAMPVKAVSLFEEEERIEVINALSKYDGGKTAKDIFPASYHQERLWLADKLEVNSTSFRTSAYTIPSIITFKEQVQPGLMEECIRSIVSGHAILRTTIIESGDKLLQQINSHASFEWEFINSTQLNQRVEDIIENETSKAFDFATGLFRAKLVQTEDQTFILVLVFHHAIADHFTARYFSAQVLSNYAALLKEEKIINATDQISYAGFSLWQQECFTRIEPYYLDHWLFHLGRKVKALELPLDRPRTAILKYKPDSMDVSIPQDLVMLLTDATHKYKVSLHIILMATFKVLLRKYCRHDEIVIGSAIANRENKTMAGVLGPVDNLIVLKSDIHQDIHFQDYLMALRDTYENAVRYGMLPFEKLAEKMSSAGDKSRNNLFDVIFNYEENCSSAPQIIGTGITMTDSAKGYGPYDLALSLTRNENIIEGQLVFNSEYFNKETIYSFVEQYYSLTRNLLSSPGESLSGIEIVEVKQREQLLNLLNNSKVSYPSEKTIIELFKEQVQKNPDGIAVSFGSGSLTYSELDKRSDRIAVLLGKHAGPDIIIGLLTDRTMEMIIAMLGILKAGSAYLPIDVDYPVERINYLIDDSQTPLLLCTREYIQKLSLDIPVFCIEDMVIGNDDVPEVICPAKPENLCYVIYTSGTTGNPKGVMVEHRNVVRLLFNDEFQYDFSSGDVWTMFHSHCFDVSVWEIYGALLYGSKIIIIPKATAKDTNAYLDILRKEKVTILNQTPSAFYSLLQHELSSSERLNIRTVIFAGEALSPGKLKEWNRKYPQVKMVNMYGITETTVHSTYKEIGLYEIENNISNVGKPLPTLSIYLLDEYGKVTPRGVIGELYVGGDGVTRGYLRKKELTDKAFLRDPYNITERVYKSGDLARILSSGELEYVGRIDHQVQLRGFRIELGEIESQLSKHEQVKEAVVLAKGEDENKFLVAYYISKEGIDRTDLRSFLSGKMPEYMIPSFFVRLERMPLTSNGKLDRRALPDPEIKSGVDYIAPENELESALVEIWSEILKIPTESISVNRSFFEIGGHSLNASALVNRISKRFNTTVSLQDVFTFSTVSTLARHINGLRKSEFKVIPSADKKPFYKVTSSQKQLFFLYELNHSSLAYNMPFVQRLIGNVNQEKLTQAFRGLSDRHQILRTTFEVIEGEVMQRISEHTVFELEYAEAAGNEEKAIKRFIRPFDLAKGPLLRAGLIRRAEEDYLLLIDIHHIINDGISQHTIIKDFLDIYTGTELAPLALQYKDYAEWHQSQEQQAVIRKQGKFWHELFSEPVSVLDLPSDFTRPSFKNDGGRSIDFELSALDTRRLKQIAEKHDCTLFMILFAAYTIFLNKLANHDDIIIGTPVSGRRHADTEDMIGLFINILPVRNRPQAQQIFSEFLKEIKQTILSCFQNQDYPYEQLIEDLQVQREMSRNPLFDVLFLFQNFENKTFKAPGLHTLPWHYEHPVSKMDLTLLVVEKEDSISLSFEYATSLFKESTIQRFITYFNNIVSVIITDDDQKLGDIDILSVEERDHILKGFNKTDGEYCREKTIISLFAEQVDKTPGNVCVVFGDSSLTYSEVHLQSNQLARQLREEFNVKPGGFVAVMLSRSEKLLIALLAVWKAGAAYVPIDPSYPEDRIKYILGDCHAEVLFTETRLSKDFTYEGSVLLYENASKESFSTQDIIETCSSDAPSYLIYTSGSTGAPKGVIISHKNVLNFFAGMNRTIPVSEKDCLLAVTSTAFDISVLELFWTICHGMEMVIYPSDTHLSGLDRYVKDADQALDFSLFFFSSYKNEDADKYKLVIESAAYADKEGFKAIWTPERHFHEFGGLYPNPSVLSAALAMVTKNIQLRSGSVVSPLHDVLRIAEEWSVVDNLSNGRTGISFASGWNPNDFSLAPDPDSYKNRHEKMYSQIAQLKALWRGESIKRINGAGKEIEVKIFPRPVQEELPVWVTSAGSPETFRNAGKKGANVLTHFLGQDINMLSDNINCYREARIQAGYDRGKVTLMLHTYVGEDITEVEKLVRAPFIEYLKSSIGLSKVIFEQAGFKEEDLTDELKDKILNNSFRRYYKEGSLIGTRESCTRMIRKLKEIGVDEIACLIDFGIEHEKVIEGLGWLSQLKSSYTQPEVKLNKPVTMMQSTPSFLNLLLNDEGSGHFLNSLQTLLVGGEALPLSLVQKIRERNSRLRIYNMYGPTETTIWSCVSTIEEDAGKISIGKPILNTQIYILNKQLKVVPVGVAGDLYIGGEGLSQGYWNRPELTEERFIQNPFNKHEKIYNTGDVAKWLNDGSIEYIGRKDHQVKIRGFRIELGEIEKCITDIKGVRDAVVIAGKEPGNDNQYLSAYVIADGLSELVVREALAKQLPYYMIPAHVIFLDKFPLTPNGKLDRSSLPEPGLSNTQEYIAPQTHEEEALAELWSKVLGVKKPGVTDNFFSLGGDSIKSIQIISRARDMGYDISVKDIFTTQHIRELALRLKSIKITDQSEVNGGFTLTPVQRWFFDGPVVLKHHYNQAVMLTFREQLKPEMIAAIFKKIQTHHDALRIIFSIQETEVSGETRDTTQPVFIEVHDLRNEPEPQQTLSNLCNKVQSGIDLATGPLMKVCLFHLAEGSKLLIVIHHLVIDGISWRILFEDIETLYRQSGNNESLNLPFKTDSFQSWPTRLLHYAETKEFQKSGDYWKKALSRPLIPISRDHPNGYNTIKEKKEVLFRLDKEYTRRILTEVHHAFGTQINDILLAGLLMAIQKVYGHVTATLDMEGHGREEIMPGINYSRTIGWFTSIFPVMLEAQSDNVASVIKQVKEIVHRIPNKGIDYLLYQYYGNNPAIKEMARHYKSQIFFNYLGQFDTDTAQKSFSVEYESVGDVISGEEKLEYDWDILGLLTGGQLVIRLIYGEKQYHSDKINKLMVEYEEALRNIIDFCSTCKRTSLTPSDLTYTELSIAQVGKLEERYEIEDICSLAPMQKAILFHSLVNSDSSYYFVQIAYKLTGNIDMQAIEKSFHDLTSRHAVMRTIFLQDKYQEPLQLISKEKKAAFRYMDLRDESKSASKEELLSSCRSNDRNNKFDLKKDCLIRLTVIRVDEREFEFIWSYHHIIMDGWCIGVILEDFKEMYSANRRGEKLQLPAVTPYSHYIRWLKSRDKELAITFWKNYLAGYDFLAGIPGRELNMHSQPVDERLSESILLNGTRMQLLQSLSVKCAVTINTILQTAWGILLAKYNNVDDVVFGSVVSGRPSEIAGIESMIGLFMNTIPVRVQYGANDTAAMLLQKIQNKAIESEPYHFSHLAEIQSQSEMDGDVFDHLLIFENFPISETVEGPVVVDTDKEEQYAVSDLKISDKNDYEFYVIVVPGKEFKIRFDYSPARYGPEHIKNLFSRFLNIIDQIIANNNISISEIRLATPQEEQQLLHTFNDTAFAYPEQDTIISLFEKQVSELPDGMALRYKNQSYTYSQLNTRANSIANKITALLPGSGNHKIGLFFEPSADLIVCMLGILKAGCAYVTLLPETPDGRNKYILADCEAPLILFQKDLFEKEQNNDWYKGSTALVYDQDEQSFETINPVNTVTTKDLLYVIYTSGTTGLPKGVKIEHKGIVNMVFFHKQLYGVATGANVSQVANIIFDASAFEIWPCLLQGACLNIAPREVRLDPELMREWLIENKIEISYQPTVIAQYLLKKDWSGVNSQLAILNIAGDRLNYVPDKEMPFRIFNLYGPTEDSIWTTWIELPYERINECYSIGKPIGNKRIYILDKNNNLQPVGISGEICISGDGLARGYINDQKLTAAKFIGNPFVTGEKLYRTGDYGRWMEDGNIEFFGRDDNQVKIRGYRIELGEIEWQFSAYPGIIETVVLVKDVNKEKQLVAYYAAENEIPERELTHYLSGRLPHYMMPSNIIYLPVMPLTPSGKLDRKALPESVGATEKFAGPSNEIERSIIKIWSEVLEIGEELISVNKSFFQLGGHSLKIISLVNKINEQFQTDLSLNDAFEKDTVQDMSDYLITIRQLSFETSNSDQVVEIVL